MNESPSTEDLQGIADAVKMLGHPLRIRIALLLSKKGQAPMSVTAIYTALDAAQAIASQHLILLKQNGLLKSHKVGTQILYSVAHAWVGKVVALLVAEVKPKEDAHATQ